MYSPEFLDHFRNPRKQGALDGRTHTGEAEDAACGDRLWLDARVEGDRVADARFRVQGCPGAIAVGSVVASLLPGRAARPDAVSPDEIERALAGLPRAKRHALRLARAVLQQAFGRPEPASDPPG